MPTSKTNKRGGGQKNRKGRLAEKASSFHGRSSGDGGTAQMLLRPRTVPDLLFGRSSSSLAGVPLPGFIPKLTKLLINVTIHRSLGTLHVVMSPEDTVEDLIVAALQLYVKEYRRPILPSTDPSAFSLHYSQFCLESLDRSEKLIALGSRNFFLCPKKLAMDSCSGGMMTATAASSSCSEQADNIAKVDQGWVKFTSFML